MLLKVVSLVYWFKDSEELLSLMKRVSVLQRPPRPLNDRMPLPSPRPPMPPLALDCRKPALSREITATQSTRPRHDQAGSDHCDRGEA